MSLFRAENWPLPGKEDVKWVMTGEKITQGLLIWGIPMVPENALYLPSPAYVRTEGMYASCVFRDGVWVLTGDNGMLMSQVPSEVRDTITKVIGEYPFRVYEVQMRLAALVSKLVEFTIPRGGWPDEIAMDGHYVDVAKLLCYIKGKKTVLGPRGLDWILRDHGLHLRENELLIFHETYEGPYHQRDVEEVRDRWAGYRNE